MSAVESQRSFVAPFFSVISQKLCLMDILARRVFHECC